MKLSAADIERIYFLTHTSLSENRIKGLAYSLLNFDDIIDKINHLRHKDLDRDWALFDFNYKNNKLIYAQNVKIIHEKYIFKDTYTHQCKNDMRYIIQIINQSGFCRKCDTQFFPKIWWENPFKEKLDYFDIKYGLSINRIPVSIDKEYLDMLIGIGLDERIINKAVETVHSPLEIEKILNTKFYDWNNPPPPAKVHAKLTIFSETWHTKPIIRLGISPDTNYFFHKCIDNKERILFEEKYYYSWCPGCFTKFIPQSDKETINKYKNIQWVIGYSDKSNKANKLSSDKFKLNIHKDSPEYYYLTMLGFNERCTIKELLDAFRKMSKLYHPDYGGDSIMFQKIVKAKEWLVKYYKYNNIDKL